MSGEREDLEIIFLKSMNEPISSSNFAGLYFLTKGHFVNVQLFWKLMYI